MYKHLGDPKPGYVADWPDLPDWEKETDADIFEAISWLARGLAPSGVGDRFSGPL